MKSIIVLICLALIPQVGGCLSKTDDITYSVRVDRAEKDAVVLVVFLTLGRTKYWEDRDAGRKAMEIGEVVVRGELAKVGFPDVQIMDRNYVRIRENIHRTIFWVKDPISVLKSKVGETWHGKVNEPTGQP